MMDLRPLENVDASHGGKAHGLRRLIEFGLQVPNGVALDSEAVDKLLNNDPSLNAALRRWLRSIDGLLAIRSSAANEDGIDHSFAGVYESALKIEPTLDIVLANVRRVSTSGRSERAISYAGRSSETIPVIIQELVDAISSGVLFSKALDPCGVLCAYIEWAPGLGDALVSGKIIPSAIWIPWDSESQHLQREGVQIRGALPDPSSFDSLIHLIEVINTGSNNAAWDVEWAVDKAHQLWALQMRPETREVMVPAMRRRNTPFPASPGISSGPVRIVDDSDHQEIENGDILVAEITEVDYIPAMRRAAGIITEQGGLLSHAAIVARELGKPCVVGAIGARSLLVDRAVAEVNGTLGTIRQGDFKMGGDLASQIDWTSLYLYDRGFELLVDGIPTYIEPTMDGVFAYVDDTANSRETEHIDAAIRRAYQVAPNVVKSDKRIWYREWRRFDQFRTITFIESLFKAAITSWNPQELKHAIALLKRASLQIRRPPYDTTMQELFAKELGAALHALVAVEVEGCALWNAYRDSATIRANHHIRFIDFLHKDCCPSDVLSDMRDVFECLEMLAKFRNEAYRFFSVNGIFDIDYFPNRHDLVERACMECGVTFTAEDPSLTELYRIEDFRRLDRQLASIIFSFVDDS